jgi:hypothetical protein
MEVEMRSSVRGPAVAAAVAVLLIAIAWLTLQEGNMAIAKPSGPAAGQIQLVYGIGGVLTKDGMLWTYRPDTGKWLTVDEAFLAQEKTTHVLPLPVPASSIAQMESFGFLVTDAGSCWLYDLEKDKWMEIGEPPARH